MLKFDLPYFYHKDYNTFLNLEQEYVNSIYISLKLFGFSDARVNTYDISFDNAISLLESVSVLINKYGLLNGRFHNIDTLFDTKHQVKTLNELIDRGIFQGFIITDFYYLNALIKNGLRIEDVYIVPSVNVGIDSIERLNSYLTVFDSWKLKVDKIILDRSLNRKFELLKEISDVIHSYGLKVEVILNEGCLYDCPFKVNHDVFISMINETYKDIDTKLWFDKKTSKAQVDGVFINHFLGCINYIYDNPWQLLKSPFIRPEDLQYYEEYVDVFKLAGRTFRINRLISIFDIYKNQSYKGNLLDLLDASSYFIEKFYIFNDRFPDDFFNIVSSCDKNCIKCNYCKEVFSRTSQKLF